MAEPYRDKLRKPIRRDFYLTHFGTLAFVFKSEQGWRYKTYDGIEQALSWVSANGFERVENLPGYKKRLEQELALISELAQTATKFTKSGNPIPTLEQVEAAEVQAENCEGERKSLDICQFASFRAEVLRERQEHPELH